MTLTLAGLPAHDALHLSFDFLAIRSWGGNATDFGIDRWRLSVVGGPVLLDTTFSNVPGSPPFDRQAYPDMWPAGDNPATTGSSEFNTLGYTFNSQPRDSVYELEFSFPHTANSVQLDFEFLAPNQGLADESWGLDNVVVTTLVNANPVPIDAPPWLLAIALMAIALIAIRRFNSRHPVSG